MNLGANTLTVTAAVGKFAQGSLGVSGDTGGFTVSGGTQSLIAVTGNYTGATTIGTGANLTLDGATNISTSSGVIDNGTFDISSNGNTSIKTLTGTGGQVNLGSLTLTITAASGAFSGNLGAAGDAGGFTIAGGTQTLSAVTGNYGGATNIASGASLFLTTATNIAASRDVNDLGTFDISGNGNTTIQRLIGTGQVNLGANTLIVAGAAGMFSGKLGAAGDTGGFSVTGGTQILDGATALYSGATIVGAAGQLVLIGGTNVSASSGVQNDGSFSISGNGNTTITSLSGTDATANVVLGSNTLTLSNAGGTYAGIISGTGGLTLASGTETLTGMSSYTGRTNINGGTLAAGAVDAFDPVSAYTIAHGAILNLDGFDQTIGSLAGGGTVALGSATLTTGNDNSSTTFSGIIGGSGGLGKVGSGAFTLSGPNTYSGGTSILAGTIVVGNDSAFGSGPLSMAAGTTMSFLKTSDFTVANNIQISGDPTFTPPARTVQTLSGIISDGTSPGTLVVGGPGTLVLSAINTYTGPTLIDAGTLDVTGSIASSSLIVNNGTTLVGTGVVGSTQVNGGGTLAPGTGAPGTSLTVAGSLAFQSGANYMVQISPSTTSIANRSTASFTTISGTASLNGTVSANFGAGNYAVAQYTVLQSAGLNDTRFSGLTTTNLPPTSLPY